jgi:protein-S-isoprenylcysteine O-methyltransferase Ste14
MHPNQPEKAAMDPAVRKAVTKWILQASLGWIGYAALLFGCAGRLDWIWGWIQMGLMGALLAAHPLLLIPINPELLAERQRGIDVEGVKRWDRILARLAAGMLLPLWVVAGLDARFGWTGGFALGVHVTGAALSAAGYATFIWAMVSNAFFAEGVRIQHERGHTVATGGPYRFVRHPGYAGDILAALATPFLLGSLWALIPSVAMAALFAVRTALEDRTLRDELEGYKAYAQRVRYRLILGVW